MSRPRKLSVGWVVFIVLMVLLVLCAAFCLYVYITGIQNGLTFIEQLTKIFAPDKFAKMIEQTKETAIITAHMLGM